MEQEFLGGYGVRDENCCNYKRLKKTAKRESDSRHTKTSWNSVRAVIVHHAQTPFICRTPLQLQTSGLTD
jgi:hypothetical protein